jgi:hypothetical protein
MAGILRACGSELFFQSNPSLAHRQRIGAGHPILTEMVLPAEQFAAGATRSPNYLSPLKGDLKITHHRLDLFGTIWTYGEVTASWFVFACRRMGFLHSDFLFRLHISS